ncbi:MAG TPA: PilZ domain-containing protein [Thermoanaerobaculia bacterium]|nr:PilZ domain-containing protein [Thermoanaerobaculia bacterium]
MHESAARNLRRAERFLLAPPLAAAFGAADVAICDISAKGARFRHSRPLETGSKGVLKMPVDGKPSPVSVEAVVVWTRAETGAPGRFETGVRTYGAPEVINGFLAQLQSSKRSNRIEELRQSDRFEIDPPLEASFDGRPAMIEDISAHGARIAVSELLSVGRSATFRVLQVNVAGTVVWSAVKSIGNQSFRAGLLINDRPELLRLVIGQLCDTNRATLDTRSLTLKLKILRARARQLAPSFHAIDASGIPAEQYLLIQGVREELRLNPEEALHWYRRARIVIADPATRTIAPPIADHPDALAVWEYLDRSIDPTIVSRAFALPDR